MKREPKKVLPPNFKKEAIAHMRKGYEQRMRQQAKGVIEKPKAEQDAEAKRISRKYDEWLDSLAEIEREICRGSSRSDLRALVKAGADRNVLLPLLAVTVAGKGFRYWKKELRNRRDRLRSLATRMETLATEASKIGSDITFRPAFHSWWFGKGLAMGLEHPNSLSEVADHRITIRGMHFQSSIYRAEADQMAFLLRHCGREESDSNLVLLVVRVHLWTRSHGHYHELARLLTEAFRAAGKDEAFSADQLRKLWDHHGKRMAAAWYPKGLSAVNSTS